MKKILILENGKIISDMVKLFYKSENSKIIDLKNYGEGYFEGTKEIPDMVIADLTSIKKEKVELLVLLKNNPATSLIPCLLITSNKNKKLKNGFSQFNYYLNKPFTKDEIHSVLKKISNDSDSAGPW
jgi:response regulator RpfG family c-di-GMP phosphodiesterase